MQVGITFDKQLLTSRQHAHFQALFLNHTDGITKGCEVSYSGENVYVQKGFFVISGRFVEVIGIETIETPDVTSGTLYCKVVYEVDLSKMNTENSFSQGCFKTLTSASGYPAVTQEDLDNDGLIYQMPFCQYTKTVDSVGSFLDTRPIFDIKSVWDTISANNSKYKSLFDTYFASQKAEIEQMIADLQGEGYLLVADARQVKTITILKSNWSDIYPYTQTVQVDGIAAADNPTMVPVRTGSETPEELEAYDLAFELIYDGDTSNGSVTFYAVAIPETDITVGLKGV